MPVALLTLLLGLAVAFSLPSFLILLAARHPAPASRQSISPLIATVGTATLGGSLIVLSTLLGWIAAVGILVATDSFYRLVYAPRSNLTRSLGACSAAGFLLLGLALGGEILALPLR